MWKRVEYAPKYLNEMVEMTIENYGPSETISHIEFVKHEYFENPSGDALVELAYDEENHKLAGQYIINPHCFLVNGNKVNSVLSLNTLTRKEYRGQKIFTGLADVAFERATKQGFSFCYGAPNPNSFPGFIKKLGFTKLYEMPLYLKPLKISKAVKEKTNKFFSILSYPLNVFCILKKVDDPNIVRIDGSNIELIDKFWSLIQHKYKILGIRDSKYIFYRYIDVPIRKYSPFVYLKEGKPVAFAVSRIREVAGLTAGMIADFLYVDGCEKEAKILMRFMSNSLKKDGASVAGCIMMPHSQETKILKKSGFIKCPDKILPQPTPLIIRVFDKKYIGEGIMDIKNWFFTTGDYDVV